MLYKTYLPLQTFTRKKQNKWTVAWWVLLICYVICLHIKNSRRCFPVKNIVEKMLGEYYWFFMSLSFMLLAAVVFIAFNRIIEQMLGLHYLFVVSLSFVSRITVVVFPLNNVVKQMFTEYYSFVMSFSFMTPVLIGFYLVSNILE